MNIHLQTEELEDVKVQLEQHKLDIKTMKESHESDKNIWAIEKQQLENKLPKEVIKLESNIRNYLSQKLIFKGRG